MANIDVRDVAPEALDLLERAVSQISADDWSRPSNLEGWSVRELVGHVTGSVHKICAQIQGEPVSREQSLPHKWADEDPAGRLREESTRARELMPSAPLTELRPSPMGEVPLAVALRFPVVDAIVHAWDIDRSLGREGDLPEQSLTFVEQLTDAMEGSTGGESAPGFDPPVAAAEGDTRTQQVMKRLGRRTD